MKEFEAARQRIIEKEQEFKRVRDVLVEKESSFINSLPERIRQVIDGLPDQISKKVGVLPRVGHSAWFSYKPDKDMRIWHGLDEVKSGNTIEKYEIGKKEIDKEEVVNFSSYGDWEQRLRTTYRYDWKNPYYNYRDFFDKLINSQEGSLEEDIELNMFQIGFHLSPDVVSSEKAYIIVRFEKPSRDTLICFKGANTEYSKEISIGNLQESNMGNNEGIDFFVEKLAGYLDNNQQKSVEEDKLDMKKDTVITSEQDSAGLEKKQLNTNNINELNEEQFRRSQDEERDRILFVIEGREASDPNYRRPSWINPEESSRRGKHGIHPTQTDYEEYSTKEAFDDAIQRHFPRPS